MSGIRSQQARTNPADFEMNRSDDREGDTSFIDLPLSPP